MCWRFMAARRGHKPAGGRRWRIRRLRGGICPTPARERVRLCHTGQVDVRCAPTESAKAPEIENGLLFCPVRVFARFPHNASPERNKQETVHSYLPESDESVSPLVTAGLLLAACEFARKLGLLHPNVEQILSATGATRSRAYELRDVLIALLPSLSRPVGRPAVTPSTPTVDEYKTLLSVSRDVMRFVIANPGCVTGQRRLRYADAFRRYVLELRAEQAALPLARFAEAANVPLETIEGWLRAGTVATASEEPASEDAVAVNDAANHVSRTHIQTVLTEWKTWHGGFTNFCAHLNVNCRVPYGATLIRTILSSHGVRTPARRQGRSPDERALRGAFAVFFPDAQWVGDGSQISIELCGVRFTFNLELMVDAYSDAFVGVSLRDEEDSKAVTDAIIDAKSTTDATSAVPLAVLLDNKPCNHTPEVDEALDGATRISATLQRPQNKAHAEGGFGLFKTTAPALIVNGTKPREIACSILALVITTFFRAANHRPRADRNGRSRFAIHGDTPTPEQIDKARRDLKDRCRRQQLARQTLEARQSPEVRTYLDRVFERLALLDPERSIRIAIARYPLDAIIDGLAIFEAKRTAGTIAADTDARYALGIVRNIAAVNEGQLICEVLLRERIAQRDRMLAALMEERERVVRNVAAVDGQLKAFADRACEIDAVLDRKFWLLTIVDTIRAQPHDQHTALTMNVSHRIQATFRIRPYERTEAVRFIVDRVVPLQ